MRWRRGSYDQQYLEKVWQESKRKELAKEIIDDPFLRMKKCKCSYICRTRLRVLIPFLTVVLLLLLKLLKADWILFFHKDRYFVEPFLSTSSFVKNKYSYEKKSGQDKINCSSIYHQDPMEIGKSLAIRRKKIIDLEDEDVVAITSNCQEYRKIREYHLKVVSPEEEEFPLAYSLVVHKDAIMVERLIHTIYSTQNIYCIHYDQKSSNTFKQALKNLVKCFSNIFIASKLEVVEYAYMSRLQADLNCLSDLLKSAVPWKYVINLCGQDFPLRSNFELVYEFKRLNGSNMLETTRPSNYKKKRFTYHYELKNNYFRYIKIPEKTDISKRPPPHNIEVFVGSAYFILCRAFVQYILGNSHVQDFLEWSKDTYSPDEHFWATLVRMPGVPGEISREAHDIIDLQSKTRLVKWSYHKSYPPCTGIYIRSVCIYGAAELRWLLNYGHWFANKFDSKVDPIVIKCLAEKIAEQQKQWVNLASEKHVIHKIFTGVSNSME